MGRGIGRRGRRAGRGGQTGANQAGSRGGDATIKACRELGRSCLHVEDGSTRPSHVAGWIVEHKIRVRNVAGNRESKAQGIGDCVERFLASVFHWLEHRPI